MGGFYFMDPNYRDIIAKALMDFKEFIFKSMDVTNKEAFDAEMKKIINKYRKEFMQIYNYSMPNVSESEMDNRKNMVYEKFLSIALSEAEYSIIRQKGFTKPYVPTRTRFKCDHINAGNYSNPKKR